MLLINFLTVLFTYRGKKQDVASDIQKKPFLKKISHTLNFDLLM